MTVIRFLFQPWAESLPDPAAALRHVAAPWAVAWFALAVVGVMR